jgi:hypothetical protein
MKVKVKAIKQILESVIVEVDIPKTDGITYDKVEKAAKDLVVGMAREEKIDNFEHYSTTYSVHKEVKIEDTSEFESEDERTKAQSLGKLHRRIYPNEFNEIEKRWSKNEEWKFMKEMVEQKNGEIWSYDNGEWMSLSGRSGYVLVIPDPNDKNKKIITHAGLWDMIN